MNRGISADIKCHIEEGRGQDAGVGTFSVPVLNTTSKEVPIEKMTFQ